MKTSSFEPEIAVQLAEMRQMLCAALPQGEAPPAGCCLETLIVALLHNGVTRGEIGFLLAQSLPLETGLR